MKNLSLLLLISNLASLLCVGIAGYMALMGIGGWGWFLVAGWLISTYFKGPEPAKEKRIAVSLTKEELQRLKKQADLVDIALKDSYDNVTLASGEVGKMVVGERKNTLRNYLTLANEPNLDARIAMLYISRILHKLKEATPASPEKPVES